MAEASNVYASGRNDVLGYGDDKLTIKNLSAKAEAEFVGSLTYKTFVDYYGKSEYADMWVQAAFDGGATSSFSSGNVDFTSESFYFSLEGRAGKRYVVLISLAILFTSFSILPGLIMNVPALFSIHSRCQVGHPYAIRLDVCCWQSRNGSCQL